LRPYCWAADARAAAPWLLHHRKGPSSPGAVARGARYRITTPSASPKRKAMTAKPSVGPALTSTVRAEFTGAKTESESKGAVLVWGFRVRLG